MKRLLLALFVPGCASLLVLLLSGCASHIAAVPSPANNPQGRTSSIKHIVIIMMENRSFDNYFGAFPGANGIPSNPNCNPDPKAHTCVLPYHDTALVNYGGPHREANTTADLDGGKLDGFIIQAETAPFNSDPNPDEVMGYHTCAEIPVYCDYAKQYTLADDNFSPSTSWSTIAHLYLVSGWSAQCSRTGDPMSCTSDLDVDWPTFPDYAWTDITWLLHAHGVSWAYFAPPNGFQLEGDGDGEGPDRSIGLSGWDPMPDFDDVGIDGETGDVQKTSTFHAKATAGLLPAVSWLMPPYNSSDHPTESIANGQAWVKKQVDAVLNGPDGPSTVILLTWDEWGGFYDHVIPPVIDGEGYGFRTPLIVIGPMVKNGHIDHQLLSSDAYLKFIEDVFLGGARLDANDGRPDSRPDVRENTPGLGDLRNDLK
jgi:phospholipase C